MMGEWVLGSGHGDGAGFTRAIDGTRQPTGEPGTLVGTLLTVSVTGWVHRGTSPGCAPPGSDSPKAGPFLPPAGAPEGDWFWSRRSGRSEHWTGAVWYWAALLACATQQRETRAAERPGAESISGISFRATGLRGAIITAPTACMPDTPFQSRGCGRSPAHGSRAPQSVPHIPHHAPRCPCLPWPLLPRSPSRPPPGPSSAHLTSNSSLADFTSPKLAPFQACLCRRERERERVEFSQFGVSRAEHCGLLVQDRCWDVLRLQRCHLKRSMWGVAGLSRSLSFKASSGAPLVKAASLKTDKPDKPAGWKDMNGMEKLGVVEVDPLLTPHQTHLKYRVREYMKRQMEIEKFEGSLQDFAKGYEKFGFNREENCIFYQEWAPAAAAAQLIGDFNNWDGSKHNMERDQFGVWSIRLPDEGGVSVIPHGSKVKFRMKNGDGTWVDRIPAWIKYAVVDPTVFAAYYDGVYWDPPASEKYHFKHARPEKPSAPLIYEAHVGMSSKEPRVASYREFADEVLPRIKANNYNTIQLMAIMEHAYYGCFGYHVTNFFAASSRSGTPEDLKYLIDKAHSMGLRVLMDVVHSHASTNAVDGLAGYDLGQQAQDSYFHTGARGYHTLWDSRLFNYGNWEVQRFLLSNLRWWMEEFLFDGFRFDGVTSMLYHHHGLNMCFTGNYHEYFSEATDVQAVMYLMLANELVHSLYPDATVIAEDVSGMPTLCRPVSEGGIGFDYRLAMAIPDKWIQYLKERKDEDWLMGDIVYTLTNRRYTEPCVGYAESHDQSMVGDKTFAFLLMDKEMYFSMSAVQPANLIVDRGIALHKMIHFITMTLGGEGYLNFMGNEFGHPEWIDFPRQGNNWSFDKCRRQWDLVDQEHLRYKFMNNFDRAMIGLDEEFQFVSSNKQYNSCTSETEKLIVFERGDLVFVFNFHPTNTYAGMKVGCEIPGKYRVCLDSDAAEFGGHARVDQEVDHFTTPEGEPGKAETNHNNRPHSFMVMSPCRSCQVYYKVPE